MNKFLYTSVISLALLAPSSAFAAPNSNSETTGNPGKGLQWCISSDVDDRFKKNPGELIRFVRAKYGQNPVERISTNGSDYDSIGQALNDVCRRTP